MRTFDETSAVRNAFESRRKPGTALVEEADHVSRACYEMSVRFHQGGKLVVFGNGGTTTDAQHISVEFVHPVIVGKRALPALSLTNDIATLTGVASTEGIDEIFAHQIRQLGRTHDIALGVCSDGTSKNVLRGIETAKEMGLLTVALTGADGGALSKSSSVDHCIVARADDPRIVKELHVTIYHVLWELVHVFFEQPALLGPEVIR